MRTLVYDVAVSADGCIAHADDTVDGLAMEGEHVPDFLARLTDDYDTVLMGARTYAWGFDKGVGPGEPAYAPFGLANVVFSRSLQFTPSEAVRLERGDPVEVIRALKETPGGGLWLCGGGALAGTLLRAGLIDELVLKVSPVLFGGGVPLFAGDVSAVPMRLRGSTAYDNGVLLNRYAIG